MSTKPPILEVEDLHCHFAIRNAWGMQTGTLRALDGVTFEIAHGEILGIVGESGCGKTTLGKAIAGVSRPTSGGVRFEGNEIGRLKPSESRTLRRKLQYCYQDPGASLDPRWKLGSSLEEPLIVHTTTPRAERRAMVHDTLRAVGLQQRHLDLYPHEISGGQQRRIGLARILMLRPSMIILDEPTSGLDVSVQAIVLNLLLDLRAQFDLTYMFISHDLSVVRLVSQRIAVMYLGRIVEIGSTAEMFTDPRHPYTRSLLAAVPEIGGRRVTDEALLRGEPPSPGRLPSGCRFRTRCPLAQAICAETEPPLIALPSGRRAACHFVA